MFSDHSNRSSTRRSRTTHAPRLGRQDSNLRSRDQNPVPCHLATPQYRPAKIIPERLFAVRGWTRTEYRTSSSQAPISGNLCPTGHRLVDAGERRIDGVSSQPGALWIFEDPVYSRPTPAHRNTQGP